MADAPKSKPEKEQHEKLITLIVYSPRQPNPKTFRWPPEMQVGTAADEAAATFGYEVGSPTFQLSSGTVLQRTVALGTAGLTNGDKLELTDTGGGV